MTSFVSRSKYKRTGPRKKDPEFDIIKFKIIVNRCDLCRERLDCQDNIEDRIARLDEDSFVNEDDHIVGPKLLLCGYCQKEYQLPGYPI